MSVSLERAINDNDGKSEIPLEFMNGMMHSNDLDVLRKVQREVIPRELSSFGVQTEPSVVSTDTLSNKLTFYVSDPRNYVDLVNSYFTADWKAVVSTNGGNALAAFMDVGGIHACIKTLTIKVGGTILMRLDDYNKWYNVNNLVTHSSQYADYMLANSLDGQIDYETEQDVSIQVPTTAANLAAATISAAGVIAALGGDGTRAQVGDLIRFNGTGGIQYGRVKAVAANSIELSPNGAAVWIASIAGAVTEISIVRRRYETTRSNCVNFGIAPGAAVAAANVPYQKIQWRLPVGCLSFLKYFPLPYIQNVAPLEIEFEFVDPRLALCLRDPVSATIAGNKLGYLISRPRFVVSLVEPSDKVRDMHDKMYNANGIWFPYLNYRRFQNRLAAADTDIVATIQTNVSSARHVFSVLTGQANDDAATPGTQAVKSQSTFYRSLMKYFRFQSGSLQFPDYGNCQCGDAFASEAFAQLLMAFNVKENTVHKMRIAPWEWQSTSSEKFIIATDLAKDDSMWTGVSLKNNFLELALSKDASAFPLNVYTFLGFDAALCISKDTLAVFD
jgi:hypothetical protein